ncbi:hypothetical protein BHE74_00048054 [Ensete ventricosum]|nr:hypothetical protein GW17_00035918 [Ensete ventricosum]RWW46046.1 hypothetical protein BHE74_00048054 [Ensete ventricosum]RZS00406.1 hypothetical protein BHM03_00030105 [Ensete ventricosum]
MGSVWCRSCRAKAGEKGNSREEMPSPWVKDHDDGKGGATALSPTEKKADGAQVPSATDLTGNLEAAAARGRSDRRHQQWRWRGGSTPMRRGNQNGGGWWWLRERTLGRNRGCDNRDHSPLPERRWQRRQPDDSSRGCTEAEDPAIEGRHYQFATCKKRCKDGSIQYAGGDAQVNR